jgi:hypothetical protein
MRVASFLVLLVFGGLFLAVVVWFLAVALKQKSIEWNFSPKQVENQDQRKLIVMSLAPTLPNSVVFVQKMKLVFPNARVWVGDASSSQFVAQHKDLWSVVDLSDVVDTKPCLRDALQTRVFASIEEKDDFYVCVIDLDAGFTLSKIHEWPRALDVLKDPTVGAVTGIGLVQHRMLLTPHFSDVHSFRKQKGETFEATPKELFRLGAKYSRATTKFTERVGNNFSGVAIYRGDQARAAQYGSGEKESEHVYYQDQIPGDVVMCGALLHVEWQ